MRFIVNIGPIPSGNEKAYYERSPINFVNQFTCPVILFQGLEDKVCDCNRYHTALFGDISVSL